MLIEFRPHGVERDVRLIRKQDLTSGGVRAQVGQLCADDVIIFAPESDRTVQFTEAVPTDKVCAMHHDTVEGGFEVLILIGSTCFGDDGQGSFTAAFQ